MTGPCLIAALDALAVSRDVLELLPEYHADQRRELESRIERLGVLCKRAFDADVKAANRLLSNWRDIVKGE